MTEQNNALSKEIGYVKFCQEESHADQFIRGSLHMNRLRYFQKLEASEKGDGRPDRHEAIVLWYQPDRIGLVIDSPELGSIKVGKNEFAGPVAITRNFYSDVHVFCMSALSLPDPAFLQGDHAEVQVKLQTALQIDPRCLEFGPHAVIVDREKFRSQLRQSLERCDYRFKYDMVAYYDETTFHGEFPPDDVPFRKQHRFAYQQEFRVCLQTLTSGDEPITLEIGDMSAFATKLPSADINAALKASKVTVFEARSFQGFKESLETPNPMKT